MSLEHTWKAIHTAKRMEGLFDSVPKDSSGCYEWNSPEYAVAAKRRDELCEELEDHAADAYDAGEPRLALGGGYYRSAEQGQWADLEWVLDPSKRSDTSPAQQAIDHARQVSDKAAVIERASVLMARLMARRHTKPATIAAVHKVSKQAAVDLRNLNKDTVRIVDAAKRSADMTRKYPNIHPEVVEAAVAYARMYSKHSEKSGVERILAGLRKLKEG